MKGNKYEQLEEKESQFESFEIQDGRAMAAEGESPSSSQEVIPRDKGNLTYLAFFSLGTGVLFPWNAFITAVDYFQHLYPTQHVDRVFSVAYMFPNLLILGVLLLYPTTLSPSARVYIGFTMYLFCLFCVPLIDAVFITDLGSQNTFNFTVTAVGIAGLADGLAQGSVFGLVSSLPSSYTQAVVSGTSVSGFVISILRILTKLLMPQENPRTSTYLYFSVAGAFCVFCIVVQAYLPRLPVYKHFCGKREKEHTEKPIADEYLEMKALNTVENQGKEAPASSLGTIFKSTWQMAMGLFLIYAVSLSIFPGFLAEDVESDALSDWYPIILIALFNAFDLAGKSAPIYESFRIRNANALFVMTCLRFSFYGLYIFATSGPDFVKKDPFGPFYVSVITAALGFSNGLLTSNCLMTCTSKVRAGDAEKTEMFMIWFLLLGLLVGALLGWLWLL